MNSSQDRASNETIDDKLIELNIDEGLFPEPKFEVKRFTINKDVYFDIEISYLEGHPIVKAKYLSFITILISLKTCLMENLFRIHS